MPIIIFFREIILLLTARNIMLLAGSTILGIIIGALPGLTATMGVALLTSITYGFPTHEAIIILIGIYVGAIYGGSISAILINIPGTGASAATCLDGYPLAQRGEAGMALGLGTLASFIGTFFGMLCMVSFTPIISRLALNFTSYEFFVLALFGVMICGSLTSPDIPLKGWIAGFLGLIMSCIGMDPLHSYPRFTFGSTELLSGIAVIPAMIGAFGIPEIITVMKRGMGTKRITQIGKILPSARLIVKYWLLILRSGLIGVGIGAIPGVGEDIASWMAYDAAKRTSKEKEKFGKGAYEGVIASETGNNSCIGGAIIPLLSLAIPGSPPSTVLLGALWLHGVRPGPMLSFEFPTFSYHMSAVLMLASFMMLVCGLALLRPVGKVLEIPPAIFMPIIAVLCAIGSYALNLRIFDIYVMTVFGIVYYFLREMGYPPAPIVLGLILGPIADANFRRALLVSKGNLLPFFTRPISLILVIALIYIVLSQTEGGRKILFNLKKTIRGSLGRK